MTIAPGSIHADIHNGMIMVHIRSGQLATVARMTAEGAKEFAHDLTVLADVLDTFGRPNPPAVSRRPPESGYYWVWNRNLQCWTIGACLYKSPKKVGGDVSLFDLHDKSFPIKDCDRKDSPIRWGPKIEVPIHEAKEE
jgi:hypothetical protein